MSDANISAAPVTIDEFIEARIAEDERIASDAIGKYGRAAGATTQHWQWERTDDDVVVGDRNGVRDPGYLYPEGVYPVPTYDGGISLRTVETYPVSVVGDGLLPDFILPDVTEPPVGAATHIARHDPAREPSEVALKRLILREHRPQEMDDGVYCVECSTSLSLNIDEVPWPCAYIEALQAIYLVTEGETP